MRQKDKRLLVFAIVCLIISLVITIYGISYRGWFKRQNGEPTIGYLSREAAQPIDSPIWETLANVEFRKKDSGIEWQFGEQVVALEGDEIEITGYICPLDSNQQNIAFALSYFPFESSYFKGMSGPETVIGLEAENALPKVRKPIKIKGKLSLNHSKSGALLYKLEGAEVIDK